MKGFFFYAILSGMGYAYNLPAGEAAPEVLVDFIIKLANNKQENLPNIDLWLPTRRAERALRQAFVARFGASLLPRIRSMGLGEGQEEHLYLDLETSISEVTELDRLMYVARQVKIFKPDWQAQQCFEQASYLLKVKDRLTTYSISDSDLEKLVPDTYAEHWQNNLKFLEIVRFFYPKWLEDQGKTDFATHLNELLETQALQYTQEPERIVIAAGFADTIPAGVALLKSIYEMPNGHVIFPGVFAVCGELEPQHPQYAVQTLAASMGVSVENIISLNEPSARNKLWQQVLLPAEQTHLWQQSNIETQSLENLSYTRFESAEDEAEAVALMMREALNTPDKSCALITNQRTLAHKVSAILKSRYGIDVNDSAGKSLGLWPVGQYINLMLKVIESKARPLAMVELLSHPFTLNASYKEKRQFIELLRGLYPGSGLTALSDKVSKAYNELKPEKRELELPKLLEDIIAVFSEFEKTEQLNLPNFIDLLTQSFTRLTQGQDFEQMMGHEDGEALMLLLNKWKQATAEVGQQPLSFYTDYLRVLLQTTAVRPKGQLHPRLFIWGPLEARLQHADRIIIAGLNEGNWPRKIRPDGWISQHMSHELGLPLSELFTGLNAHDFYMLASKSEVFLTRSIKEGGVETLPSRFLMRLITVLRTQSPQLYKAFATSGAIWHQRLAQLNKKTEIKQMPRPAVKVPTKQRMKNWSVSQVKDIMYCPYKHYVQKILRVREDDDFELLPTGREKGTILHEVLEAFFTEVEGYPKPFGTLKEDNLKAAEEHLTQLMNLGLKDLPENVQRLWLKRFESMVSELIETFYTQQKDGRRPLYLEKKAVMPLAAGVSLTAIADRIDHTNDGAVVLDYKTGSTAAKKDVSLGKQPQLILEAMMLEKGYFSEQKSIPATAVEYWKLKGGENPLKIESGIDTRKDDLETLIQEADEGVNKLSEYFMSEDAEYQARADKTGCTYCPYAGVCRKAEWEFKS